MIYAIVRVTPTPEWHSRFGPLLKKGTAMEEEYIEVSVGTVNVEVGFTEDGREERRLRQGAFVYFETEIFLSVEC